MHSLTFQGRSLTDAMVEAARELDIYDIDYTDFVMHSLTFQWRSFTDAMIEAARGWQLKSGNGAPFDSEIIC